MLAMDIPGFCKAKITHVVFDYNGTLAQDGHLIKGVKNAVNALSDTVEVHVITADTFGFVKNALKDVTCTLTIISNGNQVRKKQEYIRKLGADQTIAVGNGANDQGMLKDALIGIAILGKEGLAGTTLLCADLIANNILDVFDLFSSPDRLVASLRN